MRLPHQSPVLPRPLGPGVLPPQRVGAMVCHCREQGFVHLCPFALISGRTARAKRSLVEEVEEVEENATGGVYPAATMERGIARLAASTNEVRFGGPGRG